MNQDDKMQASSPPEETGPEPEQLIVPFEDPSKEFFTGLFETIKLILLQPTHFFKNYKLDGSIGKPLLFAVMLGWTTTIISIIWGTVISESIFSVFRDHMPDIEGFDWEQFGPGTSSLDAILGIILAPIAIAIGMFIFSGIYHLFLLMVKGANKNFKTKFNVVAYGMVSHIAEIFPFCGGIISWIYGIILAIIGLTEAHKTESWKAVFAVFGPILLCCICCLLFILVLGGTGFLATLSNYYQ